MPASCWRPSSPRPTASGSGTCPISAIRNHAAQVADILGLPRPCLSRGRAGRRLAVLRGRDEPAARPRRHRSTATATTRRAQGKGRGLRQAGATRPSPTRPSAIVEKFGEDADYGWSEDKARQYSVPERADFGAFVRAQGLQTRLICRASAARRARGGAACSTGWRAPAPGAAGVVDLGHQGVERQAAAPGDRRQLAPERVLQRDAGAVAVDGDRAFAHAGL